MEGKIEHGIIMTAESVIATIEGRKTQTRRVSGLEDVNTYRGRLDGDSPLGPLGYKGLEPSDYYRKNKAFYKKHPGQCHWFLGMQYDEREINPIPVTCPYGGVGDRVWVRETWDFRYIGDLSDGRFRVLVLYGADGGQKDCIAPSDFDPIMYNYERWRPALFMPHWASRLTLEITEVRAERLQSISKSDAIAEGVMWCEAFPEGYTTRPGCFPGYGSAELCYQALWNKINEKRGCGWDLNPWVWVISYKVVED